MREAQGKRGCFAALVGSLDSRSCSFGSRVSYVSSRPRTSLPTSYALEPTLEGQVVNDDFSSG